MLSYISFINNTEYPFVSVYDDSRVLADCIQRRQKSRFFVEDAGSVTITVKDNRNNIFLDIYMSLYPNEFYIINICDGFAEFI